MRFLHLSDVHFGSDKHAFVKRGKAESKALANIIGKLSPDDWPSFIIISGDIGWSGKKADYDDALIFCRDLRQKFSVPLLVIPGNHDVDRTDGIPDEDRQNDFIDFIEKLYGADLDKYFPFIKDATLALSRRDRLILVYQNDAEQCLIVGVNSASRINGWEHCQDCKRRVSISPLAACPKCGLTRPLDTTLSTSVITHEVADLISAKCESVPDKERWFRTFVLHHNMFPFDEPDESGHIEVARPGVAPDSDMIANSAALQDWLARTGFHLVLHGHKHQPNGRQDTLFRRDEPGGRRIVVLGAGSAGVVAADRGSEPLSFFAVSTQRLSNQRYQITAKPMKITVSTISPYITEDFAQFTCEIGPALPSPPPLFFAERMADCHAAIAHAAKEKSRVLRNFCSIVDVKAPVEFDFPPTTRRAGAPVSSELIEASFNALHPEYNRETESWGEPAEIHQRLLTLRPRFLFQHGPRMFGVMRGRSTISDDSAGYLSPMHLALTELVGKPSTSHAFVSVFHPTIDVDVAGKMGPPPALAGVQFHIDEKEKRLDLTFTFRKIDLSFWWTVNMYEAVKLWQWASSKLEREYRCTTGRITFFAALAEWKEEDTATFLIGLDHMSLEELVELALAADGGNAPDLLTKLQDKREKTNVNNIDPHGLGRLADIVTGIVKSRPSGRWTYALINKLCEARDCLSSAEAKAKNRQETTVKADLKKAYAAILEVETALKVK